MIDWGAQYQGYRSDCTRTVAVGRVDDEAREAYELVLGAQMAGLEAVRAGGDGREIDGTVRSIIADGGHGEHFGHGLGHGVGLDIHEAPTLSKLSEDTLQAGMVVTVEPGVYLPGKFGIRIEDLVVVGDDGNTILTRYQNSWQSSTDVPRRRALTGTRRRSQCSDYPAGGWKITTRVCVPTGSLMTSMTPEIS